jgi:hypothetical protein
MDLDHYLVTLKDNRGACAVAEGSKDRILQWLLEQPGITGYEVYSRNTQIYFSATEFVQMNATPPKPKLDEVLEGVLVDHEKFEAVHQLVTGALLEYDKVVFEGRPKPLLTIAQETSERIYSIFN